MSSVRQFFATLNTTFCAGIYYLPNLGRICEEGGENIPIFFPAFNAGRIGFAPLILEQNQVVHSLLLADSLIYFLEVNHQLLDVFVADKPCA